MTKKNSEFEESINKLKALSEKIKDPETNLEESIKCYEEGMKYYDSCNKILTEAQQKIETFDISEK